MEINDSVTVRQKTSMSVPEMGRLLGLKKVESYWLIKKNFFKTITAGGKMRVMIDSFEEWYSGQFKYKKTDGPPPGMKFGETMSASDIAEELGISNTAAYTIFSLSRFEKITVYPCTRIRRPDFEKWYRTQCRYTKVSGEPPGQEYGNTISAREMSDMLGIKLRNTGYDLIAKGKFKTILVNGQRRVDLDSFEKWYRTQRHYKKVERGKK